MLILLPLSHSDAKLGVPLANHIHQLGGAKRHDLVLFYTGPDAQEVATEMAGILQHDFHSVTQVDSKLSDERGWPMSANSTFRAAVDWAQKAGYVGPMYFFEADNVPLRPNWADELQDEYLRLHKPCVGVIHPTKWTSPDGARVTGEPHLVGTGIYTIPMDPYSRLWRHLTNTRTPFDVFLRHEVVPNSGHTDLIQHNWSTARYHRKDNEILCEPSDLRSGGIADPVRPTAAVLHGCKDGSLFDLFKKKAAAPAATSPKK